MTENSVPVRAPSRGAILLIVASVAPFFLGYLLLIGGFDQSPAWREAFHIGMAQCLVWMLIVLMLVNQNLCSSGESWRELGLCFNVWVVPVGIVTVVVWWALWSCWVVALGRYISFDPAGTVPGAVTALLSRPPIAIVLLYLLVAPCYEELIWRAFLMTRLERAGWHWSVAVIASTGLQLAIHLYLGWEMALLFIPQFLTASLFFVFFRNVYVLMVAHLLTNAISSSVNL